MRSRKQKKALARQMAQNMTPAELLLWERLNGLRCKPQWLVCGYIADFAFPWRRLVVEVDGDSHNGREAYDRERDAAMLLAGWRVLRFTNEDVRSDINRVVGAIRAALDGPKLTKPNKAPKRRKPKVGDAVAFGCAVRRWKRTHPVVEPTARLVKH